MAERSTFGLFRKYVWLLLLLAVVALVVYRLRFSPVAVAAHTVERGTVRAEVFGTGTLEARMRASIGSQIPGRIAEVAVDQGDRVTAGQVLVKLDNDELARQADAAEAALEAARASLERVEAERTRAEAVVEQAQRDYDRAQELYKQKAQALSVTEKAREQLAVARADVQRTEKAIAEARAEVAAAEKTLAYHRARLDYTTIEAPFDGLVVQRLRDPGDVVVSGSSILDVVTTDVLWISAWVDESQMNPLRAGQPARVVFRSTPEHDFAGEVSRLGKQVDRETREFIVDVRVKDLPENWAVGQRAEVYIETGRRQDVVLLPLRFLARRDGTTGAWVIRDGDAAWQAVTPGVRGRDVVEIVEGLEPGDRVFVPLDVSARELDEGRSVVVK